MDHLTTLRSIACIKPLVTLGEIEQKGQYTMKLDVCHIFNEIRENKKIQEPISNIQLTNFIDS